MWVASGKIQLIYSRLFANVLWHIYRKAIEFHCNIKLVAMFPELVSCMQKTQGGAVKTCHFHGLNMN